MARSFTPFDRTYGSGLLDRRLPEKGSWEGPDLGLGLIRCRIRPYMKSRRPHCGAPLARRQRRAQARKARPAHAGPHVASDA